MNKTLIFWISILNTLYIIGRGNAYINVRLQDDLCADGFLDKLKKQIRDPSIKLTENHHSAAIIYQIWNSTLPGPFLTSNKIRYDCIFRVYSNYKKSSPRGIYTLITRLKFRRHPETGECLDFIQFSDGQQSPTEHYCSDISTDGPGRLIFDERKRDVKVTIHIDQNHMIYQPLELRLVLTAHSECKYTGDFLCDPNNSYSCISRNFVRDNITNCMWPCRDEISCIHDAISTTEVDTTNVAISAITSFIFTMLGVCFCIWICWKYWLCITVQQHAHEASASSQRSNQRNNPIIVNVPTSITNLESVPTGTQIIIERQDELQSAAITTIPKDLPPSYESLFPDR